MKRGAENRAGRGVSAAGGHWGNAHNVPHPRSYSRAHRHLRGRAWRARVESPPRHRRASIATAPAPTCCASHRSPRKRAARRFWTRARTPHTPRAETRANPGAVRATRGSAVVPRCPASFRVARLESGVGDTMLRRNHSWTEDAGRGERDNMVNNNESRRNAGRMRLGVNRAPQRGMGRDGTAPVKGAAGPAAGDAGGALAPPRRCWDRWSRSAAGGAEVAHPAGADCGV
eukprot:ctg_2431.g569